MDLYRLPKGYPDMGMLGIPDIFNSAICIIEWPDRLVGKNMPESYLEIKVAVASESSLPPVNSIVSVSPTDSTSPNEASKNENSKQQNDLDEEGSAQESSPMHLNSEWRTVTLRFIGKRWMDKAQSVCSLFE
jgi:hypothetical protein